MKMLLLSALFALVSCANGPQLRTPASDSKVVTTALSAALFSARDQVMTIHHDDEAIDGLNEIKQITGIRGNTLSSKNGQQFAESIETLTNGDWQLLTAENRSATVRPLIFGVGQSLKLSEMRRHRRTEDGVLSTYLDVTYTQILVPKSGQVGMATLVPFISLLGTMEVRCEVATKVCQLNYGEFNRSEIRWDHMPSPRMGGDSSAGGGH